MGSFPEAIMIRLGSLYVDFLITSVGGKSRFLDLYIIVFSTFF